MPQTARRVMGISNIYRTWKNHLLAFLETLPGNSRESKPEQALFLLLYGGKLGGVRTR